MRCVDSREVEVALTIVKFRWGLCRKTLTGRMWLQHVEQKWGIQDNYKFPKSSCIVIGPPPVTSEIKNGLRTEPNNKYNC